MLKDCPESIDVLDLQFKLQCRLKVFENKEISHFSKPNSLLSCASRYGLLFIGSSSNYFVAVQTNILQSYDTSEKDVADFPRRIIPLSSPPKHLCVNCDSSIIAVIVEEEQCPVAIFYDVLSFLSQKVKIIRKIRLSITPGVYVQEINWNPSLPRIFTACKSDGALGVYELKGDSIDINELPAAAGATCFCWSPKGKQIAVGSRDGKITQYKPDLKAVKVINPPELEGSHKIISLQWVSNFQFIGAFQSVERNECFIIVVDAPKTGEVCYTNFFDVCYSGTTRQPQFYLLLQQTWNILMVASANSTEVGVLGCTNDLWTQWIMSDTARAELPLSTDHQETFPVGVAFDISSTTPLPWGEGTIPPCPVLCILSHQGVLCCFNVVYLKEGVPSVCTPADNVSDTTGLTYFVSEGFKTGNISEAKGLENTPPKERMVPLPGLSLGTNIPIQSTPLLSMKGVNNTVAKTLFGGVQATITPIKSQESVQSASLSGGQTLITPIAKDSFQREGKKDNFNEKYSSIYPSSTPSSMPLNVKVPVKPIVVGAVTSEATKPPEPSSGVPQSKDSKKRDELVKQELQIDKAEMKVLLLQMTRDEWISLETELRVQWQMGASLKVNIGSEEEKLRMVENIRLLEEFINEAVDISLSQGAEIHCLKQNIIQAWAWHEEAKSHYNVTKDEALALLLKLQPLDSLSKKKREAIEQLDYYIETQMAQANKALDEQWNKFQDYTRKSQKAEMPTLETIFQTIVHQNAILQKQTHLLKDISFRLKRKTPNISAILSSIDKSVDLVSNLENLSLDPDAIVQLQYEKVKKYAQNVSAVKSKKLHTSIKAKPVRKVLAVKPKMSSWSINLSPSSKTRESLSKLDALSASVRAVQLDVQGTDIDNKLETSTSLFKNGTAFNTSLGNSAFTPIAAVSTSNSQAQVPKFTNSSYANVSQSSVLGFNSTAPSFKTDVFKSTTNLQGGSLSNAVNQQHSTYKQQAPFGTAMKPISESSSGSVVFSSANKMQATSIGSAFATATTQPTFSSFNKTPETLNSFGNKPSSGIYNLNPRNGETKFAATATEVKGSTENPKIKLEQSNIVTVSLFSEKPSGGSSSTTTNTSGFFSTLAKPASTTVASSSNNFNMSNFFSSINTAPALSGGLLEGSIAPASAAESPSSCIGMASNTAFDAKTIANSNVAPSISTSTVNISSSTNSTSTSLNLFALPGSKQDSSASAVSTNAPFGLKPVVSTSSDIQNKLSVSPIKDSSTASSNGTTSVLNKPSIFGSPASFQLTSSMVPSKSEEATPVSCSTGAVFGTPFSSAAALASPTKSDVNIFATTTATTKESGSPFTSNIGKTGFFSPASSISGQGLFGSSAAATSTTGSVFSSGSNNNVAAKSTSQSIFGGSASATSSGTGPFLGGASGTTSTQNVASGFVSSGSTATTVFGGVTANPETTSTFPGFGSTATTSSSFGSLTATNLFGTSSSSGGTTIPNTKPTIFGTATVTTSTTTGSIFGAPSTASNGNIFGGALSSGTSAFGTGSVFGSSTSTTTTASSGFGGSTTTPAFGQSGSIFGATSNTNVNKTFAQSTSIFGGAQSTTASSMFGKPAISSTGTSSIFGQTTVSSSSSSVFGQPAVSAATSSIFGQPAVTSSGASSVFGQSPTSSASSIFGQPATSSSGSLFGSNSNTTLFASGNSFGQSATANPFGKAETSTFGASNNIFGNAPATSAPTNIFGNAPTSTSSSIFGGNTGSTFGSGTTSSGFGSSSTFGSPSTFGQKPAFGQTPAFGSSTFGSPQQPGPFSGGGTGAGTAFGASPAFQKPSGFGSAPVFGGSPTVAPAFGSAATFGGTPTFGSGATFGSPDKVFGGNQPAGGFGATPQSQNAGFGNLAAQNTIGFGNLAQQAATPPANIPFSGGSSFSSWR